MFVKRGHPRLADFTEPTEHHRRTETTMLGIQHLPNPIPTPLGRRATLLALAAVAVGFLAISGSAQAQAQDCAGGYRMVKGEIPVLCQGDLRFAQAPIAHEPLITGSIHRAHVVHQPLVTGSTERVSAVKGRMAMQRTAAPAPAANHDDCVGGMRWIVTPANGDTLPMKCS
jgi:hypothetical protein